MMKSKLLLYTLAGFTVTFSPWVAARDIADEVTDVEEITADSEAAKRIAAEHRKQVELQKQENDRELKAAREARQAAEAKRMEANRTLVRSESEMSRLTNEKGQIQKDIVKAQVDTQNQITKMNDVKAKADLVKQDLEAIRLEKAATVKRMQEAQNQKMDILRESGALQDEKSLEQKDLEKAIAEEKAAVDDLEKTKAEALAQKGQLEAKVAELKAKFRQLREQRRALSNDIAKARAASERLDEQARIGNVEINRLSKPAPNTNTQQN